MSLADVAPDPGHALTSPAYLDAVAALVRSDDDGLLRFDQLRPGCHVRVGDEWMAVVMVNAGGSLNLRPADDITAPLTWYPVSEGERFTVRGSF